VWVVWGEEGYFTVLLYLFHGHRVCLVLYWCTFASLIAGFAVEFVKEWYLDMRVVIVTSLSGYQLNSPRLFICGTRAVDQYLSRPQVDLLGCGSAPAGECRQRRLSLRSVW